MTTKDPVELVREQLKTTAYKIVDTFRLRDLFGELRWAEIEHPTTFGIDVAAACAEGRLPELREMPTKNVNNHTVYERLR